MRIIDADALLKKAHNYYPSIDHYYCSRKAVDTKDIIEAPTIETVEWEVLLKQLYRERSRLSRVDKDFEARMGGYNPSSFTAGFIYALERIVGWATSLEAERRTDATD